MNSSSVRGRVGPLVAALGLKRAMEEITPQITNFKEGSSKKRLEI